jgi:peroxiredoxin
MSFPSGPRAWLVLPGIILCLTSWARLVAAGEGPAAGPPRVEAPPRVTLGSLKGPDGKQVCLAAPPGGVSVLIFYSPECPISNGYSPTLRTLRKGFEGKPVTWVGICVDPDLSDEEVQAHARDFDLPFPIARDPDGALARKLGATISPEAFVIDAKGTLRYHGRIDDQFASRRVRNAHPSGNDLKEAVEAVLAGKAVRVPHVPAVGCPIPQPKPPSEPAGRGPRRQDQAAVPKAAASSSVFDLPNHLLMIGQNLVTRGTASPQVLERGTFNRNPGADG